MWWWEEVTCFLLGVLFGAGGLVYLLHRYIRRQLEVTRLDLLRQVLSKPNGKGGDRHE